MPVGMSEMAEQPPQCRDPAHSPLKIIVEGIEARLACVCDCAIWHDFGLSGRAWLHAMLYSDMTRQTHTSLPDARPYKCPLAFFNILRCSAVAGQDGICLMIPRDRSVYEHVHCTSAAHCGEVNPICFLPEHQNMEHLVRAQALV
jgi:hypothetical protein